MIIFFLGMLKASPLEKLLEKKKFFNSDLYEAHQGIYYFLMTDKALFAKNLADKSLEYITQKQFYHDLDKSDVLLKQIYFNLSDFLYNQLKEQENLNAMIDESFQQALSDDLMDLKIDELLCIPSEEIPNKNQPIVEIKIEPINENLASPLQSISFNKSFFNHPTIWNEKRNILSKDENQTQELNILKLTHSIELLTIFFLSQEYFKNALHCLQLSRHIFHLLKQEEFIINPDLIFFYSHDKTLLAFVLEKINAQKHNNPTENFEFAEEELFKKACEALYQKIETKDKKVKYMVLSILLSNNFLDLHRVFLCLTSQDSKYEAIQEAAENIFNFFCTQKYKYFFIIDSLFDHSYPIQTEYFYSNNIEQNMLKHAICFYAQKNFYASEQLLTWNLNHYKYLMDFIDQKSKDLPEDILKDISSPVFSMLLLHLRLRFIVRSLLNQPSALLDFQILRQLVDIKDFSADEKACALLLGDSTNIKEDVFLWVNFLNENVFYLDGNVLNKFTEKMYPMFFKSS